MNTSYYSKNGNHPKAVAISAKVPEAFKGRHFKKLAPSWSIWKEWKYSEDFDNDEIYTSRFENEILSQLDARDVYNYLGDDAILLCYETPGKFCHRHLVSKWLERELGIVVTEI